MTNSTIDFEELLHFCKKSCQIVMLLPRQKDWYSTGEKRTRAISYFVQNYKQRETKVEYLYKLREEWAVWRIYSTYNPRSLRKWASNLASRVAKGIEGDDYSFMCRWKGIIASCLKKQGTRFSKDYYMLDVDDPKELSECRSLLGENYVAHHWTPSGGYHVLFKPMDVREFEHLEWTEVKTDEFVFVW